MKKRRKFRRFSFGGAKFHNENIYKTYNSDLDLNLYGFQRIDRFCRKHGRPQH